MSEPLTPVQRHRLVTWGFALALAAGLLGLISIALAAGPDQPGTAGMPGAARLVTTPDENPDQPVSLWPVTPTPFDGVIPRGAPTSSLPPGEVGERSAPTHFTFFLPLLQVHLPPSRAAVDLVKEPPPAPPTPEWPDGLSHLTSSKLGLHVTWNNDPFIMEFIRRARPRVVKAVDDVGWLADVKQVSPNTITLGRFNDQDESVLLAVDPVKAADDYIAAHLDRYRASPAVDFWEGWNEFVPVNNERMAWYAAFEARRACQMQALGLHAAVGGFSVGVPEYDQMRLFMPALRAAYDCGGLFTLHEYNSPTLSCGVQPSVAGLIPGAPYLGNVTLGYHTLRYRFWYEGYLKPLGMGDLPLVISEAGIEGRPDAGGPCADPGGRAWKSYGEYWVANGLGASPDQAYVNVLAWYDNELRQDSYVWGATLFTAGASYGDDKWNPFDLHDVLVSLAYYAVGQP